MVKLVELSKQQLIFILSRCRLCVCGTKGELQYRLFLHLLEFGINPWHRSFPVPDFPVPGEFYNNISTQSRNIYLGLLHEHRQRLHDLIREEQRIHTVINLGIHAPAIQTQFIIIYNQLASHIKLEINSMERLAELLCDPFINACVATFQIYSRHCIRFFD